MGGFHFFKPKQIKEENNNMESIENRFARLYHRIMVLKANYDQDFFPRQTVIDEIKLEMKRLQQEIFNIFQDRFNQEESLSLLQQKAEKLSENQFLFQKAPDGSEASMEDSDNITYLAG